jgi:2Fe-2S ferredoxin
MTKFTLETRDGTRSEVAGKDRATMMKLIRKSGVEELVAECGGSCTCATCQIYVDLPDGVAMPPIEPAEAIMLAKAANRQLNSRLACQMKFDSSLDGMHVRIAPEDYSNI